jgi:hypothetical protein
VECAYLAERMPLDGRMVLTKLKEAAGKMHQACVPIHESSRSPAVLNAIESRS